MSSPPLTTVRRFNRTVTQRIGVLYDEYLARGRPLGASRVLWEVDAEVGTDVRAIRALLDLDSGYLSRLLRRLEDEGLVTVQPDPADQRARLVHLTEAGRAECRQLDQRSDELAHSLLSPLSERQQQQLVDSMSTVERLLTAGMVEIDVEDPQTPDAMACLRSYFTELDQRFHAGFDPDASIPAEPAEMTEPAGLFLVARLRGDAVACGALKFHGRRPAELKRMWVSPGVRGLGVGRRMLAALEQQARARGVRVVRLETNASLHEAIAMYRSADYAEVPAFNDEQYADHWFEKRLA
jgi:DNA-binding MarR family transcriptional regulator/GNAT superfamily N-acetyltransferase